MSTLYTVLGLSETATADEIKQAYRALAKKYHPDLHPGDESMAKKFAEVNEAMETLGDPVKRKAYDDKRKADKLAAERGAASAQAAAQARAQAVARARAQAQAAQSAAAARPFMGTAAGAAQIIADAQRKGYNEGFAAGQKAAQNARNATAETWKRSAENWKQEAEQSHEEVAILKAALEKARNRAADAEASVRRLEIALKVQTGAANDAKVGANMEIDALRESYEEKLAIEREARKYSEDDKLRLSREVMRLKDEVTALTAKLYSQSTSPDDPMDSYSESDSETPTDNETNL